MTVIAYRDGVMAADSAVCHQGFNMSYGTSDKLIGINGWIAGAAGKLADCQQFFRWLRGSKIAPDWNQFQGMVLRPDGRLFEFDASPSPIIINYAHGAAIGSGANTAIAAMMAGASAAEAVQITCDLDHECGGPIIIIKQ